MAAANKALQDAGITPVPALKLVGSTYIKDYLYSDVDLLVTTAMPVEQLFFDGWSYGGSSPKSGDGWCSWKRTVKVTDEQTVEVNLLVCSDESYIKSWLTAADACRFLSMAGVTLTKGQVHGVHAIIMDGRDPVQELYLRNYE